MQWRDTGLEQDALMVARAGGAAPAAPASLRRTHGRRWRRPRETIARRAREGSGSRRRKGQEAADAEGELARGRRTPARGPWLEGSARPAGLCRERGRAAGARPRAREGRPARGHERGSPPVEGSLMAIDGLRRELIVSVS